MTEPTILTISEDRSLCVEGFEPLHVTGKEFALLLAIAGRHGGVLRKNAAMTELYGGLDEPEPKIVDVFVCKLRQKLKIIGVVDAIETVWGEGYRWSSKYELKVSGATFLTFEAEPQLVERLDDLALACNTNMSSLLNRIVSETVETYEKEAWA
ncbi:transcriptional regulator [Roseobacter phage RDJL6]|nr:transcriptional regulator [Roseobacter phage RDJL6]